MKASRKADRIAIAAAFREVADKFGATVEQREESPNPGYCGAGIFMSFTLNGVGAQVSIDDLHERHGMAGALISWYNTDYPVRDFAPGFNTAVGDNSHFSRPHHKATSIGSWDVLAARLQAGLRHAANGTANGTAFIEGSE
jgi:hypothetical protein